jgi:integrase
MAEHILRDSVPNSTPENKPTEPKKRNKKIPGIYQRGNRWQIDTFYRGIRLRDNCSTPEMAEANLRKMKTLVDEGRWLDKKRKSIVTLGEFIDRYLKFCEGILQKDYKSKNQRLGVVGSELGRDKLLADISTADIEQYQANRLSTVSRKGKLLTPATVNRELAALKHLFTKAIAWGILDSSPAKRVMLHKENNRRLRYLTPEECQGLIESCNSPLDKIVTLALQTGMRKGEVLHLKWQSVYLKERYIEIVDQKNGERSAIPLNDDALEALRGIPRHLDSPYVFPGEKPGKPFYDLTRRFEKAVEAAKLKCVTFHTLRHTAASHMVMAGVDLTTVKEIMRHKSIAMTLRYSHLSPGHRKAAVDALGKALRPDETKSQQEAKTA